MNRVIETLRVAAARSLAVRAVLMVSLAISVTVGGVMAGALVLAPAVARATRPDAVQKTSAVLATVTSLSQTVLTRTRAGARVVLSELPAPVSRFAVPGLAVISVGSAMLALFMRRRQSMPSLVPVVADQAPRTAMLTPRMTGRVSSRGSSRNTKTPRAVEALAASGASALDIAWKTGLPIDAVQLLLAISTGARQLQPPTA